MIFRAKNYSNLAVYYSAWNNNSWNGHKSLGNYNDKEREVKCSHRNAWLSEVLKFVKEECKNFFQLSKHLNLLVNFSFTYPLLLFAISKIIPRINAGYWLWASWYVKTLKFVCMCVCVVYICVYIIHLSKRLSVVGIEL